MYYEELPTILLTSSLLLTACGHNNHDNANEKTSKKSTNENKVALQKAAKEYRKYTNEQLDQFLKGTEEFVSAIKADDIEKAKFLYPKVRMYYERSEPVAEAFGDLDPKIDARLADMKEEKKEDKWTGYHKIEKSLYQENKIDEMTKKDADQLLKDAKELDAKIDTLDITPKLMLQGSVDLLNEVSTSKITGEEEIYSHTDLYDFKANIEGAQKIYELFKSELEKKDKKLSSTIMDNFNKVNQLLNKYKNNNGYKDYSAITKEDRKALSDAVNSLGEPLSKMAVITE
ncbi:iron uptake system protein EfeO [Staphylococcus hominis]|uniref:iron uptake system protein EfeO n=1 Tax=Staphylococcus hominis TaxID=1290 RepID=UPI0011AA414C|nr:iron uptake system protein EfeO [Staphylococcus hominis]